MLLGVVQQQIVIVQCPLLQGLPIQISLLISLVRMMAVKVSNQDCRMRNNWWSICVVPVFSWWFVDVGNVISTHTNDITSTGCVIPVFSWCFVDVGNVISAHTNDITARRQ